MFSKIMIIGNLGADPEMRYLPSGQAVTNFSVAVNRKWTTPDGEQKKETTWFRVSAWGKTGEACSTYLHKGSLVFVEGRLTADPATGGPRTWTAQDGSVRASFELSSSNVRFLSTKQTGEGEVSTTEETAPAGPPTEDEMPF